MIFILKIRSLDEVVKNPVIKCDEEMHMYTYTHEEEQIMADGSVINAYITCCPENQVSVTTLLHGKVDKEMMDKNPHVQNGRMVHKELEKLNGKGRNDFDEFLNGDFDPQSKMIALHLKGDLADDCVLESEKKLCIVVTYIEDDQEKEIYIFGTVDAVSGNTCYEYKSSFASVNNLWKKQVAIYAQMLGEGYEPKIITMNGITALRPFATAYDIRKLLEEGLRNYFAETISIDEDGSDLCVIQHRITKLKNALAILENQKDVEISKLPIDTKIPGRYAFHGFTINIFTVTRTKIDQKLVKERLPEACSESVYTTQKLTYDLSVLYE